MIDHGIVLPMARVVSVEIWDGIFGNKEQQKGSKIRELAFWLWTTGMVAEAMQLTHFFRKYTGTSSNCILDAIHLKKEPPNCLSFSFSTCTERIQSIPSSTCRAAMHQNITKSQLSRMHTQQKTEFAFHLTRQTSQFPTFSKTSILGSMHEALLEGGIKL